MLKIMKKTSVKIKKKCKLSQKKVMGFKKKIRTWKNFKHFFYEMEKKIQKKIK